MPFIHVCMMAAKFAPLLLYFVDQCYPYSFQIFMKKFKINVKTSEIKLSMHIFVDFCSGLSFGALMEGNTWEYSHAASTQTRGS